MDLLKLFEGLPGVAKAAIADFRAGKSAREVAETHIEPHIEAISANAGQEMDPAYVAYLIQYVVSNSNAKSRL